MPEEMEVKSNHLVISVLIHLEEPEDGVGVDREDSCACFSFPISPGGFLADPDKDFCAFFARFPLCSDMDLCAA